MPEKHNKNTPKKKLPSTAWKPGQSGNPNGRPKKGLAISERIRENVTDKDWDAIIACAVALAKGGDKASRDFLSDRTEGKPVQHNINENKELDTVIGIVIDAPE